MELVVKPNFQFEIDWNYEEIKNALTEKVGIYETMVYTENDIKAAKNDRSELNKLKKALNDKRIALQKDYMKSFDESFKTKVDELIGLIDKPVEIIDAQIKEFENRQKEDKNHRIRELFDQLNPFDWLKFEQIFNSRWMTTSASMESIKEEMSLQIELTRSQLDSLNGLDFEFEAKEYYKTSLSLAGALGENMRLKELKAKKDVLEKTKEEPAKPVREEPKKTEPVKDESPREWVSLKININMGEYERLTEWMDAQDIEWRIE